MLATASRVNGLALRANLFLLFWLTLIPFVIRWIGLAGIVPPPVVAYGEVTVMAAFGYIWLEYKLRPSPHRTLFRKSICAGSLHQATFGVKA